MKVNFALLKILTAYWVVSLKIMYACVICSWKFTKERCFSTSYVNIKKECDISRFKCPDVIYFPCPICTFYLPFYFCIFSNVLYINPFYVCTYSFFLPLVEFLIVANNRQRFSLNRTKLRNCGLMVWFQFLF